MTSQRKPRNSCTRYQPLIDLMIDGELEHGRTNGLQNHMRACPECREVRKDLLRVRSLAATTPEPELDLDFVARVKETLFDSSYTVEQKEVAPFPQAPRRENRAPQLANVAVYAAMLMIGCFFAFGAYHFGRVHESKNVEDTEQAILTEKNGTTTKEVLAGVKDVMPATAAMVDPTGLLSGESMEESGSTISMEPDKSDRKTPFLNSAIKSAQDALDIAEEEAADEDDDLFDGPIPTEDVVLSSMARDVLASCATMEIIRKEVSAKMPTIEGAVLHASPLVMNVTETTIDLQELLKKGTLIPGSKLITAEKMNIVFEIEGNGVHLRIEVDNLNNKEPRVNVVDMTSKRKGNRRHLAKPAVKKLKLR